MRACLLAGALLAGAGQPGARPPGAKYDITVNQTTAVLGAYPLPVELLRFAATAVANRDGQLLWRTASEPHNDH